MICYVNHCITDTTVYRKLLQTNYDKYIESLTDSETSRLLTSLTVLFYAIMCCLENLLALFMSDMYL
jgi:hypothetical protein